jgi:hypothetical protein
MAPLATSGLAALGWDESFAGSFHAHAALGRIPGRVVAVHKETSIVRDGQGDRVRATGRQRSPAASASTPWRPRTSRLSATGLRWNLTTGHRTASP